MKLKIKVTLGVGLLFILIVLLGIVGAGYILALKTDTGNILSANYNTLQYTRNMLVALEDKTGKSLDKFQHNLVKQENNITEIGELDVTQQLRQQYELLKENSADTVVINALRSQIFIIIDMNMQAIQRKSEIAKSTANKAVTWIAITGALCFAIAFALLIGMPAAIANPVQKLNEGIKQIARKNYAERLHFNTNNEFGQLAKSFNLMAEKLQEYNNSSVAKLMMEKKRVEALISNMHDPVIVLDENLRVVFANSEAHNITGLSQQDFIGQYAQQLAIKNDLIRTLIQELVFSDLGTKDNKPEPIKIFTNNKEGYFEKEIVHTTITPAGETKKRLVGHVIILRNITQFKELDAAKTNFIATVSHEFKTPIASIKMSLQLLENEQVGKLNEEQKNLVDSIKDDVSRLLSITGELLNITQVESGNIQLAILPAHPNEILQYALNATKTQAEQKHIKIAVNTPEYLPKVLADQEKTAWVLTNLIANAIRYSYDHSTVFITLRHTAAQKVEMEVKDTGQGIAPQYREKIFDRYFRVPGSKKEGTGLGLAISKEFMEAQGGQISVQSEYGVGSTFTISLSTTS